MVYVASVRLGKYYVFVLPIFSPCLTNTTQTHRCQPSRIRRDSPAFSSDVPRSREISRCPAFFENGIIIFFVADYSTICLATQQSDELRIKIGSKFARRQATDYKYTVLDQCDRCHLYYTRGSRRQRLFNFFNAATPASRVNTATVVFTDRLRKSVQCDVYFGGLSSFRV